MKNVYGVFKYLHNGMLYVVYSDYKDKYNIIYYASCHIKGDSVLAIEVKGEEHENIIKEFIFNVINNKDLSNFEFANLDSVKFIEIIGSSRIEVKPEVESTLLNLMIPKKEEKVIENNNTKKKSNMGLIIILLIIGIGGIFGYSYFFKGKKDNGPSKNDIVGIIICNKSYNHKELNAVVNEEKTFNFNVDDNLLYVSNNMLYKFNSSDEYADFVTKGLYYKYIPNNKDKDFNLDDANITFKVNYKDNITTDYNLPTSYEEVLAYYNKDGYNCTEENK